MIPIWIWQLNAKPLKVISLRVWTGTIHECNWTVFKFTWHMAPVANFWVSCSFFYVCLCLLLFFAVFSWDYEWFTTYLIGQSGSVPVTSETKLVYYFSSSNSLSFGLSNVRTLSDFPFLMDTSPLDQKQMRWGL